MAKLYWRYGTVSCAKTLNLLAVAHNYETQGKRCLLVKPRMDVRFGKGVVKSRAGLTREADILIDSDASDLDGAQFEGCHCVLVDEAQFLSPAIIERFREIASGMKVPVICYGLRNDFRTNLFPGARRLFELADTIEEVKTTCHFCNSKATLNLKAVDGVPTTTGPAVCLGCEELYLPVCYKHFKSKVEEGSGVPLDFKEVNRAEEARLLLEEAHNADEAATQATEAAGEGQEVPEEGASPERAPRLKGDLETSPSPENITGVTGVLAAH